MKNNTIDGQILGAKVAIENALNNEVISTTLADYSYDATKLQEGKALQENAESRQELQKKEYGEQFDATDELEAARASANRKLIRKVKLARITFKEQRGIIETLDIAGRRKQSYSGWIKQSRLFYKNALSSEKIKAELAKVNISEQNLQSGLEAIKEVENLLAIQFKEKGEAQAATVARDQALDDLQDWMSDFIAIARIALEDQPQLIEMLGIKDQSTSDDLEEEEEVLPET